MNKKSLFIVLVIVLIFIIGFKYISSKKTTDLEMINKNDESLPNKEVPQNTPSTTSTQKSQLSQTKTTAGKTLPISIQNFSFVGKSITINTGDTIVWTNTDDTPHTVTSDKGGELASPQLSKSETYSHTFATAGTYTYHCAIHTGMKGVVIVK